MLAGRSAVSGRARRKAASVASALILISPFALSGCSGGAAEQVNYAQSDLAVFRQGVFNLRGGAERVRTVVAQEVIRGHRFGADAEGFERHVVEDEGVRVGKFSSGFDVEEHIVDPEAAAAVAVELPHPGVHQRIRRDAECDGTLSFDGL